jgi:hypothetical protein
MAFRLIVTLQQIQPPFSMTKRAKGVTAVLERISKKKNACREV